MSLALDRIDRLCFNEIRWATRTTALWGKSAGVFNEKKRPLDWLWPLEMPSLKLDAFGTLVMGGILSFIYLLLATLHQLSFDIFGPVDDHWIPCVMGYHGCAIITTFAAWCQSNLCGWPSWIASGGGDALVVAEYRQKSPLLAVDLIACILPSEFLWQHWPLERQLQLSKISHLSGMIPKPWKLDWLSPLYPPEGI